MQPTTGFTADEVLDVVKGLEAAAPDVNSKSSGGIGGDSFKIADIV